MRDKNPLEEEWQKFLPVNDKVCTLIHLDENDVQHLKNKSFLDEVQKRGRSESLLV